MYEHRVQRCGQKARLSVMGYTNPHTTVTQCWALMSVHGAARATAMTALRSQHAHCPYADGSIMAPLEGAFDDECMTAHDLGARCTCWRACSTSDGPPPASLSNHSRQLKRCGHLDVPASNSQIHRRQCRIMVTASRTCAQHVSRDVLLAAQQYSC
jgi:hypothetical protein